MRFLLALALTAGLAHAEGDTPGEHDYWVLALSWSPTWCALEGDARQSPQCDETRDLGWVLHGLWPQYERGWPSNCRTMMRNPSRAETGAMADIMGTSGSAWHQWKKHGRCSGLSSTDYFRLARFAYDSVQRPDLFRRLDTAVKLPAAVVEEAFLEENETISAAGLTVTCKARRIQEVRICLDKEMRPRTCGADVSRDCQLDDALMSPVR